MTREIFATKREELRTKAAEAITARLASEGIIVREVLLRDLQLPAEYAKGLEGLFLKEQENERLGTEQEISRAAEKSFGRRGESHPRDGRGGRGADEVRGIGAETESHAHPENHRRAVVGQAANHDGADGWEEFLCQ